MSRLALTALATAVFGTGCFVENGASLPRAGSGALDLAWRFQASDGQLAGHWTAADTGCATAAITDLDVTLIDDRGFKVVFQTYPCEEGGSRLPRAYITGLAGGRYGYEVTGYRGNSPVFTDSGTLSIAEALTTTADVTLGVVSPAPLTVYFDQRGQLTCSGTPTIRYDRFTAGGVFIEKTVVACDPLSGGFTVPVDLPIGNTYQFDVYALDAGGNSVNEMCRQSILHSGFPAVINLLRAPDPSCG